MTNQRNHDLHQLYKNKDLLIFVNGLDWFIAQANAIHAKHGSLHPDDDRSQWDLANGYCVGSYGPPAVEIIQANRINSGYRTHPRR